jgi:hypothetical protein
MTNNATHIKRNIDDLLKELGPEEIVITRKVLTNIRLYSQMYQYMTEYILTEYPDIDTDKISKISGKIDDDLLHINFGERLFVYNKLDRSFIVDFFKKELKDEKYLKSLWIDEVNTMMLSIHPDMKMKNIEKIIKEIEEKLKNLKYEEKWLIYNTLGHIIIQDLIGELEES